MRYCRERVRLVRFTISKISKSVRAAWHTRERYTTNSNCNASDIQGCEFISEEPRWDSDRCDFFRNASDRHWHHACTLNYAETGEGVWSEFDCPDAKRRHTRIRSLPWKMQLHLEWSEKTWSAELLPFHRKIGFQAPRSSDLLSHWRWPMIHPSQVLTNTLLPRDCPFPFSCSWAVVVWDSSAGRQKR